MFENLIEIIHKLDEKVFITVEAITGSYVPSGNTACFVVLLPHFVKFLFYSLLFLTALIPIKFIFPYSKKITLFVYILLIFSALLLFGVFLGFFQLLWTS